MCSRIGTTTLKVLGLLLPFKLRFSFHGFSRIKVSLMKWTKNGVVPLVVPGFDLPLDITIWIDVQSDSGHEQVICDEINPSNFTFTLDLHANNVVQ